MIHLEVSPKDDSVVRFYYNVNFAVSKGILGRNNLLQIMLSLSL